MDNGPPRSRTTGLRKDTTMAVNPRIDTVRPLDRQHARRPRICSELLISVLGGVTAISSAAQWVPSAPRRPGRQR